MGSLDLGFPADVRLVEEPARDPVLEPCLATGVDVPLDRGEAVAKAPPPPPPPATGVPDSFRITMFVWRTNTPCLSGQEK